MTDPTSFCELWRTLPTELKGIVYDKHIELITDQINFAIALARVYDFSALSLLFYYRDDNLSWNHDFREAVLDLAEGELTADGQACPEFVEDIPEAVRQRAQLSVLERLTTHSTFLPDTCRGCGDITAASRVGEPPHCDDCIDTFCT